LSLNIYTYCHNSPLKYRDPNGKSAQAIFYGGWTAGGVVSQLDSPIPGPADVARLAIGVGGTLLVGGYLIYEHYEEPKGDRSLKASEHTKNKRKSPHDKHTKPRLGRDSEKKKMIKNGRKTQTKEKSNK
jgi:hypothetical protein